LRYKKRRMPSQEPPSASTRIESIDWLRGMVMILMLLDHARDFIHHGGFDNDPLDAATTTPALYLTRWVTHLCAPTFVFLAGVSARLQLQRGLAPRALSRFLLTRGLFLVGLELFILRPLMFAGMDFEVIAFLQVIWALGWSMVVLAGLIFAPLWLVALFGAALVLLHNLFDGFQYDMPATTLPGILWTLLHQDGVILLGHDGPVAMVKYPLGPWIGVMALGYIAGGLFALEPSRRRRLLAGIGAAAVACFLALRWSNLYGDPHPWRAPHDASGAPMESWRTACAFFDVEKYPPSFLYVLITLGISLGLLACLDGRRFGALSKPVLTFGRVPLFFYVLQWPLLKLIAAVMRKIGGQEVGMRGGFGLSGVYLGWAIGLVVLYPLCLAFARLKRRHKAAWLSYL
ncbi:MAG: heparan-alpha-glucosaminide N-acetyltransferase domain-containing protein, partial [Planctomycetota bacterium]